QPRPRGRRFAAAVPAREPASRERRERRIPEPLLRAARQHLRLVSAIEQRVRILYPAVAPGRRSQYAAVDVRAAVGADPADRDELVQRVERLGERHIRIRRVREEELDALDAETLE